MSHFTVLVIGENPEEQLTPFDENLRTEFEDKTEEYKKEYETESTKEFYCDSSSSWGQEITEELFQTLKKSRSGRVMEFEVNRESVGIGNYYRLGGKYRGYHLVKGERHERCKGDQWFEVTKILETTHPDPDVCSEGKLQIKKIARPKKITLKDKYGTYKEYLSQWHGIEDEDSQGYHFNPKAKWDWYQLGGRWSGFFTLKPGAKGNMGDRSLLDSGPPPKSDHVDQAKKGDIDFDAMANEKFENLSETYDEFEKEVAEKGYDSGTGYFKYGVENTGTREEPVAETRTEYLKRCGTVSTFAVLKDGEWYEKGEMGWFACVSDEKAPDAWRNEFNNLLDSLSDDTLLSLYDCHI